MVSSDEQVYISIGNLAKRWDRSVDHIKAHIKAGRLRAVNTGAGAKMQFIILLADVIAFEEDRQTKPRTKRPKPPALKRPKNHFAPKSQTRTNSATAINRSSSME